MTRPEIEHEQADRQDTDHSTTASTSTGALGMRIGPIARERECDHGGPLFPSDPGVDHVTPCNQRAVFAVPWPDPNVLGARVLCRWHLARYLHAYAERDVLPKLRAHFDVDGFVPEHTFLEIEDAPESIDQLGHHWLRVGIDQRGEAHYLDESADRVLVLTAEFEAETYGIPASGWTGWLAHVRDKRGWATFDPRVVPDDEGGERA